MIFVDQVFCFSKIYDAATSELQWAETMNVISAMRGRERLSCVLDQHAYWR